MGCFGSLLGLTFGILGRLFRPLGHLQAVILTPKTRDRRKPQRSCAFCIPMGHQNTFYTILGPREFLGNFWWILGREFLENFWWILGREFLENICEN